MKARSDQQLFDVYAGADLIATVRARSTHNAAVNVARRYGYRGEPTRRRYTSPEIFDFVHAQRRGMRLTFTVSRARRTDAAAERNERTRRTD